MYVMGFVLSVEEGKKDAYRRIAGGFWNIAKDYGALEQVEAWEADVPDGEQTDFRRAVQLAQGEKVVFSWLIFPDKATADASHELMMADPRMKEMDGEMPYDGERMIYGGFDPLVVRGRG